MKNYTRLLFVILLALVFSGYESNAQVTIAQWTFDSETLTPDIGSGTADPIGGTTTAYAGGNPSTGRGWNTTPYPEQSTLSGTAGVQFTVSTSGYSNVVVSWDNRHSNTAANRIRLQYTLNGDDWVNFEASETNAVNTLDGVPAGFDNGRYITNAGAVWFVRSADFTAITGANDNAAFAIRLVTEFEDGASYGSAGGTTYGTGGTIRFDNVTLTGAGSAPLLVANPSSLSGFTYIQGAGPSPMQSFLIYGMNLEPQSGDITLTAPASFELSLDNVTYSNSLTLPYANGALDEMDINIRLIAGLAAGSYNEVLTGNGGGAGTLNLSLAGTVTTGLEPALTNVILPRFMEGSVPNTNRVPFAYYATITNLLPNTTYRYYNRVVVSTDPATATGAGNIIIVNPATGTFTRITSPNLGTAGQYGEFTTDISGSYYGWFMTEPTGNATRFKPGTDIYMRILLNDGNNGTLEETFLTTDESVKVIAFSSAVADTAGTAIRGISDFTAKNFVFLYDNTEGTGRPLFGTQVEATGIDFAVSNSYAPFYTTNVATMGGAWGGIVPNINANGVMRIEERDRTDCSVLSSPVSVNGVWSGTDTRNPTGSLDQVLVINTTLGIPAIDAANGSIYTYNGSLCVKLTKAAQAEIHIINLQGQVVNTMVMNGSQADFTLDLPAGIYLVKVMTPSGIYVQKVFIRS